MDVHGLGGPNYWPLVVARLGNNKDPQKDRSYYRTPESRALQQCKNEIQKEEKWDDFKKITNPYEYVFLSWNRRTSRSVSTRQPLSRSYFKMIEIWKSMDISSYVAPLVEKHGGLRTAHSAEGPGGFIEACWESAQKNEWTVEGSIAITLRSEARNVPGWRKAVKFLADHPQIEISDGADGTGNILNRENQDHYIKRVYEKYPEGVHLYTADGGFDFSSDYNSQEDVIFPLLLAEVLLGIQVLSDGGCLVIKCFDTTERPTLDLLWLLTLCFREWTIVKPNTSRAGNAERYFVGKGFVGDVEDVVEILQQVQEKQTWNSPILHISEEESPLWRNWVEKILKLQEQIEIAEYTTIRQTLNLIHGHDFSKIRSLVRENVQRSIQWCVDYDEPVSHIWTTDLEKNITRETQDLMFILSPELAHASSHSWYSRTSSTPSTISFHGFRSRQIDLVTTSASQLNPFTRYSSTFKL